MSIKSTIIAAAAVLALAAGTGAAGTLTAGAATPKCGQLCSDFYSRTSGPAFVLDTASPASHVGQPVTLARASRASKGEDFSVDALGTVNDFYKAGLLSGKLNALYGGLSAYEIEYTPGASPSDLCLGTASLPGTGTPVTLQPCGMQANTVWIFVPQQTSYVLISAATSNSFRHPYVLTAPKPGASLVTAQLVASTAAEFTHQLWGAEAGVLPSSAAH